MANPGRVVSAYGRGPDFWQQRRPGRVVRAWDWDWKGSKPDLSIVDVYKMITVIDLPADNTMMSQAGTSTTSLPTSQHGDYAVRVLGMERCAPHECTITVGGPFSHFLMVTSPRLHGPKGSPHHTHKNSLTRHATALSLCATWVQVPEI